MAFPAIPSLCPRAASDPISVAEPLRREPAVPDRERQECRHGIYNWVTLECSIPAGQVTCALCGAEIGLMTRPEYERLCQRALEERAAEKVRD